MTSTNVLKYRVGQEVRATKLLQNYFTDEGILGVWANRGDILVVKEIRENNTLMPYVVSAKK